MKVRRQVRADDTLSAAVRNGECGQAMVEFMLVVVFLFLLFVSILQTILYMYAYTTLANAAKEGVRYAIVHGTGSTNCSGPWVNNASTTCTYDASANKVKAAVTNFAGVSFQNVPATEVTVDYNPGSANGRNCNLPGCLVKVSVIHAYHPVFGLPWPNITMYANAEGTIMN